MFDVESWINTGGLALVAAIVFAESGLLIGLLLPGDTLLFISGFLASEAGGQHLPALPITAGVIFLAAAAGDQVGYAFGRRVGPTLFVRPRSRLFSPAHVVRSQEYFEAKGPRAVVGARFIPIVRTFTPVIAGVSSMPYRRFTTYNLLGAALWGVGITTLGYYLGEIGWIKENLDYAAVLIFVISMGPMVLEYRRNKRHRQPPLGDPPKVG